jgi:hypothetical protein
MSVNGVYKVVEIELADNDIYEYELHIQENKTGLLASLKGPTKSRWPEKNYFTRTFYNGRTFMTPAEKESHNFIFYNAQVDDYVDLVPPGGFHIGGVEFAGTVVGDTVIGTIKFKNGLVYSVHGTKIKGEPEISSELRKDGIVGVNLNCPCNTMACTHHGFCDSCQLFDSSSGFFTQCIYPQYEKHFIKKYGKNPPPPAKPLLEVQIVEKQTEVKHGPHHLVEQ